LGPHHGESETTKQVYGGNRSGGNHCGCQCGRLGDSPVGPIIMMELPDGLV
jgi:hypothetical protein